jgi:hypothetical protein
MLKLLKSAALYFQKTYAGPWPDALFNLVLVTIGGALLTPLLGKPIELKSLIGSGCVALIAFGIGVWAKYHLTPPGEDSK